ncbi:hypothetical protein PFISCL1PPCAC_27330, partial [Pristionchus fissidentatus]
CAHENPEHDDPQFFHQMNSSMIRNKLVHDINDDRDDTPENNPESSNVAKNLRYEKWRLREISGLASPLLINITNAVVVEILTCCCRVYFIGSRIRQNRNNRRTCRSRRRFTVVHECNVTNYGVVIRT